MDSYKYSQYIKRNQETRWATVDEIKGSTTYIDVTKPKCPIGGLPIISNGRDVYVDGKDTHTLIFGATGSKKTRLFCMPTLNYFIRAGESFCNPFADLHNDFNRCKRRCVRETLSCRG